MGETVSTYKSCGKELDVATLKIERDVWVPLK